MPSMRRNLVYAALLSLMILGLGAATGALAGMMFKWSSGSTTSSTASVSSQEDTSAQRTSESEEGVFVHLATAQNVAQNSTYIDYPLANANPSALLFVTPNWNAQDPSSINNDHPIGVRYDPTVQRWAIFNEDQAAMPVGAAFNVSVRQG